MTVLAWHFLPRNRRLAYGDGRLVKEGQTLRVKGEPILCKYGMHGSRRLIDALWNAPGLVIERVEIGANEPYKIVEGQDKLVGNWRKTLWWIDATMVLHEFACREAENALRDAGVTDERCWDAIRIKRLWVQGKATNDELAESHDIIGAVSNIVTWNAARATARAATRNTAWNAARATARAATRNTAWIAARRAVMTAADATVIAAVATTIESADRIAIWDTAHRKEWKER